MKIMFIIVLIVIIAILCVVNNSAALSEPSKRGATVGLVSFCLAVLYSFLIGLMI